MDYLADKCQYGLISRLKEEYPSLTKDDVTLCSLISMGFPHTCHSHNLPTYQ